MSVASAMMVMCGLLAVVVAMLCWSVWRLVRQLTTVTSWLLVAVAGVRDEPTMRTLAGLARSGPPPQSQTGEKPRGLSKPEEGPGVRLTMGAI